MINNIYAVYDEASKAFVQFVPCQNDRLAEMTMTKLFKEKRLNIPMIYDYPNCFKLYLLGTFDDNKGLFENSAQQEFIMDFASLAE